MEHAKEIFNVVAVGLGLTISSVFGGWDGVLTILLTLIIADYISGLVKGGKKNELSSSTGFNGLLRKGMIFLVVILAHQLDVVLNSATPVFRTATAYFYIANEAISITENAAVLGLPLPNFLVKALKSFKTNVEVKTNEKN